MAHPYEVAAMFPPCAVDKLTLTGRTFTQRFTLDDLIPVGTLTAPLADLLRAAVDAAQRCGADDSASGPHRPD
jgi:Flp pilus assembly CpaF family ATPase